MEIEAKFIVSKPEIFADILKLSSILEYELSPGKEKLQRDIYYDTRKYTLLGNSMSFRVREKENRFLVTFKSAISQAKEIFERGEIEEEISTTRLDILLELNISPVEAVKKIIKDQGLGPVLEVDNHRQTIDLTKDGKFHFEISLDNGVFKGSGKNIPFYELEIETKAGKKSSLERICEFLRENFDLAPSSVSKYERGVKCTLLQAMLDEEDDGEAARLIVSFREYVKRRLNFHDWVNLLQYAKSCVVRRRAAMELSNFKDEINEHPVEREMVLETLKEYQQKLENLRGNLQTVEEAFLHGRLETRQELVQRIERIDPILVAIYRREDYYTTAAVKPDEKFRLEAIAASLRAEINEMVVELTFKRELETSMGKTRKQTRKITNVVRRYKKRNQE